MILKLKSKYCDLCGSSFDEDDMSLYCDVCSTDICEDCFNFETNMCEACDD